MTSTFQMACRDLGLPEHVASRLTRAYGLESTMQHHPPRVPSDSTVSPWRVASISLRLLSFGVFVLLIVVGNDFVAFLSYLGAAFLLVQAIIEFANGSHRKRGA